MGVALLGGADSAPDANDPGGTETGGGGAGDGATPGEMRSSCSIRWIRVVRSRTCSRSCLIPSSDTDQVASGAHRSNYQRNSSEFHLFFCEPISEGLAFIRNDDLRLCSDPTDIDQFCVAIWIFSQNGRGRLSSLYLGNYLTTAQRCSPKALPFIKRMWDHPRALFRTVRLGVDRCRARPFSRSLICSLISCLRSLARKNTSSGSFRWFSQWRCISSKRAESSNSCSWRVLISSSSHLRESALVAPCIHSEIRAEKCRVAQAAQDSIELPQNSDSANRRLHKPEA